MCKKAVEEDANMLKYVPEQYKTQEMSSKAGNCPWLIGHVSDNFKTQETCTRDLEVCPWSLEYIPDWFVTCGGLNLWHDDTFYCNDDGLNKCYEDHKKRKPQKDLIKEELLPIA